MGTRCALVAALALAVVPTALAQEPVTVGYRTPSALRGLDVVRNIAPLRIAEVRGATPRKLRERSGIRWAEPTRARRRAGEPAVARALIGAAPEWQWAATRSDLVPEWVQRAAAAVTIAVVDTGADLTAPDLAAKHPITHNVATDRDDVTDEIGHGTFVASVAAGSITNGDGIAGFGGDAQLVVVQANAPGTTGFTDADEAAAIVWAVDHGARIVNLSLGGPSTSRAEREGIAYAIRHGVLLVAAGGNTGNRSNRPEYPAALLGRHGLAVAATTPAGTAAPFSNTGRYLSIAAPGVDVLGAVSALSPPALFPRAQIAGASSGVYALGSGTSYAAPQVAGAAALVWAANPLLTADDVVATLELSASGGGRWTASTGYGVLDVAAAVMRAIAGDGGAPTRLPYHIAA
jgi:subtilisin family serine protease